MLRSESFVVEFEDGVAIFTLRRPHTKNALLRATYADLRDNFRAAARDDTVTAIVLTGAEGNFCSGGDVREVIGKLIDASADELHAWNQLTADTVAAMRALPKPVVAAVDGVAVGGGAALALAADQRLGTENTRLAFAFPRIGLSAADMGITWLLPRLVGMGPAARLLLRGDTITGPDALTLGLLDEVVPPATLRTRAIALAHQLAAGPKLGFATTKRLLDQVASLDLGAALDAEAEAQTTCMRSPDFREGYQAFVEKRAPRFGKKS